MRQLNYTKKPLLLNRITSRLFYKLSKTFEDLQKYDLATENYQKITSLNPDHSIANHMINALTGKTTKAPPDHYVKQLFDSYATKFERSLVEDLNYDQKICRNN